MGLIQDHYAVCDMPGCREKFTMFNSEENLRKGILMSTFIIFEDNFENDFVMCEKC